MDIGQEAEWSCDPWKRKTTKLYLPSSQLSDRRDFLEYNPKKWSPNKERWTIWAEKKEITIHGYWHSSNLRDWIPTRKEMVQRRSSRKLHEDLYEYVAKYWHVHRVKIQKIRQRALSGKGPLPRICQLKTTRGCRELVYNWVLNSQSKETLLKTRGSQLKISKKPKKKVGLI